jgi:hypothetical protein
MRAFLQAQAAGVDSRQTNFVAWQSEATENLAPFGQAEDDRQLLFGRRAHQVEGGPVLLQRALKEELETADGAGGGGRA